jgi:lysozyme
MLPGIDTSHYSNINLQQLQAMVKEKGLYFNYLKASEGATIKDPAFTRLWSMSRSAGLLCGAYHFFRPLSDVGQQVTNFVTQYKKVSRTGVLPPVMDLEWSVANRQEQWAQVPAARRIPVLKMFLSGVESELKCKPMIYTAPSFWNQYIAPQTNATDIAYFAEHPLWVVDLRHTGRLPAPWKAATFVQNHFGENATTNDPYDHTDQDFFPGDIKSLLNTALPGLSFMKNFPFSPMVIDLQKQLKAAGYLEDEPDGYFGENTEQAVKDFQTANALFANGIVDAQTWNKLWT